MQIPDSECWYFLLILSNRRECVSIYTHKISQLLFDEQQPQPPGVVFSPSDLLPTTDFSRRMQTLARTSGVALLSQAIRQGKIKGIMAMPPSSRSRLNKATEASRMTAYKQQLHLITIDFLLTYSYVCVSVCVQWDRWAKCKRPHSFENSFWMEGPLAPMGGQFTSKILLHLQFKIIIYISHLQQNEITCILFFRNKCCIVRGYQSSEAGLIVIWGLHFVCSLNFSE